MPRRGRCEQDDSLDRVERLMALEEALIERIGNDSSLSAGEELIREVRVRAARLSRASARAAVVWFDSDNGYYVNFSVRTRHNNALPGRHPQEKRPGPR